MSHKIYRNCLYLSFPPACLHVYFCLSLTACLPASFPDSVNPPVFLLFSMTVSIPNTLPPSHSSLLPPLLPLLVPPLLLGFLSPCLTASLFSSYHSELYPSFYLFQKMNNVQHLVQEVNLFSLILRKETLKPSTNEHFCFPTSWTGICFGETQSFGDLGTGPKMAFPNVPLFNFFSICNGNRLFKSLKLGLCGLSIL